MVGQNRAFVNACFHLMGLVLWTLSDHITSPNQSPFIATRQSRSQDSVPEGPSLTRAQGMYPIPKTENSSDFAHYFS